jgi:hypothetical protein
MDKHKSNGTGEKNTEEDIMAKDKGKQEEANHNFLYLIVPPRLILDEQCNMLSRLYYGYSVTYSPGYIRQELPYYGTPQFASCI